MNAVESFFSSALLCTSFSFFNVVFVWLHVLVLMSLVRNRVAPHTCWLIDDFSCHGMRCSEYLELLEDKLREYRFLDQDSNPDQKAILLGQLESIRRELLNIAEVNLDRIVFGKEIVRDVIVFASIGDKSSPRDSYASPPRHPSSKSRGRLGLSTPRGATESSSANLLSLVSSPSRRSSVPESPQIDRTIPSNYNAKYTNEIWEDARGAGLESTHVAGPHYRPTGGSVREGARRYRSLVSMSPSRTSKITDEDIYGPQSGNASQNLPSTSQRYGGVVQIRDMLMRAEKDLKAVAEAQHQRRIIPPRIYSDDHEASPSHVTWNVENTAAIHQLSPSKMSQLLDAQDFATPRSPHEKETLDPMNSRRRISPTKPKSSSHESSCDGDGIPAVVSKLAGWAFVLGSIAAATMVASTGIRSTSSSQSKEAYHERGASRNSAERYGEERAHERTTHHGQRMTSGSSSRKGRSGSACKQIENGRYKSSISTRDRRAPLSSSRNSAYEVGGNAKKPSQAPVMHVHAPPASETFPSNPPPDVTAAMG